MGKVLAYATLLGLVATRSAPVVSLAATANTTSTIQVEHATLVPVGRSYVHGTAIVTFNAKHRELTVLLKVTGLRPKSVHTSELRVDGFLNNTYTLNKIVADSRGDALGRTVFHNVSQRWRRHPWIIVDKGPNLDNPVNASVIAEGPVK